VREVRASVLPLARVLELRVLQLWKVYQTQPSIYLSLLAQSLTVPCFQGLAGRTRVVLSVVLLVLAVSAITLSLGFFSKLRS
jgi:hypothetical protein